MPAAKHSLKCPPADCRYAFELSARILLLTIVLLSAVSLSAATPARSSHARVARHVYLGFDRNLYPGDEDFALLHKTFSFVGYWLNNPPGERANTWEGKRAVVEAHGFGFAVLFNARTYAELKASADAAALGKADAELAAASARKEGFPARTIIFLDEEDGGRLPPEEMAYIYAWVDEVAAHDYRAGIYCSGIPVKEGDGNVIVTAEDVRRHAKGRQIFFWVSEDQCPPSPGCACSQPPPSPSASGTSYAEIWQFAQSPRRKDFAAACPANYSPDGNCYSPLDRERRFYLDVESATSPDPSHARSESSQPRRP